MKQTKPVRIAIESMRANLKWLAGTLLLGGLVAGPMIPQPAAASIGFCRTDPIVKLSDGTQVRLQADILDTASDVRQVVFTLRAPAGVQVKKITYLGDLAAKENVIFIAGGEKDRYVTVTRATTGFSGIPVTATTDVRGVGSASATGVSGQDIVTQVTGHQGDEGQQSDGAQSGGDH